MKQSEFKKRYDPELGRFTRQHIYGEGVMDIGSNVFGSLLKKAAKTAADKAVTTAASKTGKHVGKKAGDKIISMLKTKNKKPKKVTFDGLITQGKKAGEDINKILTTSKPMLQQDRYQKLGRILSDD